MEKILELIKELEVEVYSGLSLEKTVEKLANIKSFLQKSTNLSIKYDETFNSGVIADDDVLRIIELLNHFSHKPDENNKKDVKLMNGSDDFGDESYLSIYDKKFRIVLFVED